MTACCPDEDRIDGIETRDGRPVSDLHRHCGLLRGFVAGEQRAMHWYRHGRLTPLSETDVDLELGGLRP